jgi:ATP-dependent Clp protease protease subunit
MILDKYMNSGEFSKLALQEEFNAEDRIGINLLDSSIHYLSGEINEENVGKCICWIIYENLNVKSNKILTLYINSTGGDLYEAFALIDIMRNSKLPIRVIGLGSVMSAAFLIFASGTQGERYAGQLTSFMSHQFSNSTDAKYHDLKAEMKEGDNCNSKMIDVLKQATGFNTAKIRSKFLNSSDTYMTAQEAVDLNIVDHIF